jgi:uncharacterized heparinase superfamily protein
LQTRPRKGEWEIGIQRECSQTAPNRFRFLNQERRIESWNDPGTPKLWLYNLHYFESPTADLIQKWIAENPVGKGNGWEPYPLSLRICNWIKWSLAGNPLEQSALESLALQTSYLAQTVEYHLLGNHLLANAKALLFAGALFEGAVAEDWLASGLRIMTAQLPEQVLADGGHYERSPMYHSLILEDVLDLVNLHRTWPDLLPDWSKVAGRMLGWLQNMTHPDGRIAFFNDAAFGVAPEVVALTNYAERLAIQPEQLPLGDSGYIRLENDCAVVLFDAAPIGPDYQPGHAHADTLSFELSVRGRRTIVNSGTSTYEKYADRHIQRGTASHNTIRIDGQDSSEVWSAFRVARRARPIEASTDGRAFARASHTGYLRLKDPVRHTRTLELLPDALVISDAVEARGRHYVEIYFHLHPEADVSIQLDGQVARVEQAGTWFPEFNKAVPNRTIIGRWFGQFPAKFVTYIPFK